MIFDTHAHYNDRAFDEDRALLLAEFPYYGIGGVVAGYQAAGFKGAALGGAAGLMANLLAAGILGGMGLVGLPMFVITCAIGTIVGKKVPQAVFSAGIGKKKMEEVKQATKNNIQKAVREMRREQYLEKWIEELVVKRFEELADQMDDECETLLQDTERSMNAIRKDLVRSRTDRENVVKMLENAETRCINLIKGLEPICQRVNSALREA